MVGSDQYQNEADLRTERVTDKDLLQRSARHQGWTSINVLEIEDTDEAAPLMDRMMGSRLEEHGQVQRPWGDRLLENLVLG